MIKLAINQRNHLYSAAAAVDDDVLLRLLEQILIICETWHIRTPSYEEVTFFSNQSSQKPGIPAKKTWEAPGRKSTLKHST